MSSRLDAMGNQWQAFAGEVEHRDETVDGRFIATDRRIDLVHDRLWARIDEQVDEASRQQRRTLIKVAAGLVMVDAAAVLAVLGVLS